MAEPEPEPEQEQGQEALRLKSLAEAEFKSSNLKAALKLSKAAHRLLPSLPGLSEMITCFKVLTAASTSAGSGMPDYYRILQVEPFSHINSIRKQYKSLALAVHPDKNPSLGSNEAFKVVGDAFRVLTDSIRRKEYDMRLRISMQEKAAGGRSLADEVAVERFWTACSRCKILHQFEKKYLGHNLVCSSCGKSFKAVEIGDNDKDDDDNLDKPEESSEPEARKAKLKWKATCVDKSNLKRKAGSVDSPEKGSVGWDGGRLRKREPRSKMGRDMDEAEKRGNNDEAVMEEETMTLAEMQLEAKRKINREKKMKLKEKEKEKGLEHESAAEVRSGTIGACDAETGESSHSIDFTRRGSADKPMALQVYRRGTRSIKSATHREIERAENSQDQNLGFTLVEDSDFYDFSQDRSERRIKKGQVWAAYDKADGMPRKYCLIDEVVSLSPFTLRVSWLNVQDSARQPRARPASTLVCGQFKLSHKTSLKSPKQFSHVVDCERAARELYRIYPTKGSVWVFCNGSSSYDIVVFFTTYSEAFGLSMANLERVDGFKTVFKRREIGPHAIRWLQKSELGACSHQIPARKLEGGEVPNFLRGCWELDPAALPPDLLTIPIKR